MSFWPLHRSINIWQNVNKFLVHRYNFIWNVLVLLLSATKHRFSLFTRIYSGNGFTLNTSKRIFMSFFFLHIHTLHIQLIYEKPLNGLERCISSIEAIFFSLFASNKMFSFFFRKTEKVSKNYNNDPRFIVQWSKFMIFEIVWLFLHLHIDLLTRKPMFFIQKMNKVFCSLQRLSMYRFSAYCWIICGLWNLEGECNVMCALCDKVGKSHQLKIYISIQ